MQFSKRRITQANSPVDPMCLVETRHNGRSERTCGIHGATRQRNAPQLASEEGNTDTDWSERRSPMLLNSQH